MKKVALTLILSSTLTLSACQTSGHADGATDWVSMGAGLLNTALSQNASGAGLAGLSAMDMSAGLREALRVGTDVVVNQLGQSGGFMNDSAIRIPLPSELQAVDNTLSKIGLGALTDDLKSRMNRAAEIATPKAKDLFITAISSMTITDAKDILTGPNTAATTYLRKTMGAQLGADISPIIQNALNQAGAIQAYDNVIGQYQAIPFMPDLKGDLNNYVVEKALDGIFFYVAQEEASIRENPAKRTSEILQKVFGAVSQ